jgi:hypothetical protein
MSEINNWLNDHPEIRQTAPKWILDKIEADPRDAEIYRLKKLITELADALEDWACWQVQLGNEISLIQRAREAAKHEN